MMQLQDCRAPNENASLQSLLALRLPVRAHRLVHARSGKEILDAVSLARQWGRPFLLLGGGTNILLREDFPGTVIRMDLRGISAHSEGDRYLVRVAAGEDWPSFVQHSLSRGWYGLENLSLIPGTAGAAPVRNIGAYGVEISEFLHRVEVLDLDTGEQYAMEAKDCGLDYRSSLFLHQKPQRLAITAVHLNLLATPAPKTRHTALAARLDEKGLSPDRVTPLQIAETVCALRKERLPDPATCPNAGSFFTNPVVGAAGLQELLELVPDLPFRKKNGGYQISAARLIEQAGWKGKKQGSAAVCDRHALVLVNEVGGSAADLMALAEDIGRDIRERFGVRLDYEPCIY